MPDTCLDTTRSTSLDVRLMRVLNAMAEFCHDMCGKEQWEATEALIHISDWSREISLVSQSIRADIPRPSQRAHDLIESLRVAVDLDDAIAASATTLRCLPAEEKACVLVEIEVLRAKRGVDAAREWAR